MCIRDSFSSSSILPSIFENSSFSASFIFAITALFLLHLTLAPICLIFLIIFSIASSEFSTLTASSSAYLFPQITGLSLCVQYSLTTPVSFALLFTLSKNSRPEQNTSVYQLLLCAFSSLNSARQKSVTTITLGLSPPSTRSKHLMVAMG
eukprot:TRINITY_DN7516_c0_g2_i4.p1 TRINITY_DN7516_c0_g2~~TRINITY_DN7516_c0_g2_i4.p1  ORF type:complete len:150 (+),score=6.48 TRINITY_DN7516_c0_g2_i4:78-527(+)